MAGSLQLPETAAAHRATGTGALTVTVVVSETAPAVATTWAEPGVTPEAVAPETATTVGSREVQ